MAKRAFASLSLLLTALPVLAAFSEFKLKEAVRVPQGWQRAGHAPIDHVISMRIGLPQANFALLEQHLYEVSDPNHSRYGQHLLKEEVEELVAPHPESLKLVDEWLISHGFSVESGVSRSPAKDWIHIDIPVSLAEKMLNTTYFVWKHINGDSIVRAESYSLPKEVHGHVDVIQPTTMFGLFKPMGLTSHWDEPISKKEVFGTAQSSTGVTVDLSCNSTITPQCLQALYQIDYKGTPGNGNKVGVTGYLEQYASKSDLDKFYSRFNPAATGSDFKFYSVSGGLNNESDPGGEATLDVQYAFGLAYPAEGVFYSTAGRPPFTASNKTKSNSNEPYADWLDFVLNQDQKDLPQVISTSYGDDEQTVPESYARRVCNSMAQLGARGVTLVFSSGDYGVGDGSSNPASHKCYTNDGKAEVKFIPVFPATCPFVTSIGGTHYINETGIGFSGGGFSFYFSRPEYQDKAVKSFKKTLPKGIYAGLYNENGRAFPDVSAQSSHFAITYDGTNHTISGTSASAPAIAGIFGLLNDVRFSAGLPPLGFVNPLLYEKGTHAWNDITSGNNPGCGTPGFNATKGWDPVTGLGTPNFPALKHLVVHQGKDYP